MDPGPDAGDVLGDDAAPPNPDAPACTAGAVCTPADPCHAGVTSCDTGAETCATAAALPDGTTCATDSACSAGTCKPGAPITANGTCTYVDQPGWLSCPTGMSCRCYYHYYKLFENQPAHLDLWRSGTTVEVTGGMIPQNQTVSSVSHATITLAGVPLSGGAYPYNVTVDAMDHLQVKIYTTSGYVPQAPVQFGDSDCGNEGKLLDCTFNQP